MAAGSSHAATIIKLNLGEVSPDVAFAGGVLGTQSDGVAGTTGDQNTAIEYTGFLDAGHADINTSTGSFSLTGLTASGAPGIFGSVIVQNFTGGSFSLYDPSNNLLLSGTLVSSALSGVVGTAATGALFTASFATLTGGSLQPTLPTPPVIDPTSLSLSMNLTDVNSGSGFALTAGVLQPFTADAAVSISASPAVGTPEPGSLSLLVLAGTFSLARRRHR